MTNFLKKVGWVAMVGLPVLMLRAADPSWNLPYERVENGPEGDLVVRVGDVDNLGFGWGEEKLDPFTGAQTEPHPFPWEAKAEDHPGTDRIMVGTGVAYPMKEDTMGDGYSQTARPHNVVRPVEIELGAVPDQVREVLVQVFIDDFQSPRFESQFQVTVDGRPVRRFERLLKVVDQTGPVGKLISFRLDPEHHGDLADGKVTLKIDDPDSGVPDGYALDFVRVLVNPKILHPVEVLVKTVDRISQEPVPGVQVTSALSEGITDVAGQVLLKRVPAGLVYVEAVKPGYRPAAATTDIAAADLRGEVVLEMEAIKPGRLRVELAEGTPVAEPGAALIIFDASGSMLQRLQGRRRIEVARETLTAVLDEALPDNLKVGLRVFGEGGPGSCESVLRIPVGPLDRAALESAIAAIQPVNLSKTPIGASLEAAAKDLDGIGGPKLVLLLTDGEETCGGNPEQAVVDLRAKGLDVRVNIVGFALDQAGLKASFERLAELGGGAFFAAGAEDLAPALRQALAVPFEVKDASGAVVARGTVGGDEIELPSGEYMVHTPHAGGLSQRVTVPNDDAVTLTLGQP